MGSEVKIFSNEMFGDVRIVDMDGEPHFVAKDVASALEYAESSNPARIFQSVPEEWKVVNPIHTPGGEQKMLCLSEQGLYFFLGRSDKPSALPYQKWIAGDIVPSIRKHGAYMTPEKLSEALLDPDVMIKILTDLKEERAKRLEAERTKALIGSKREATAMATASAARRELEKVKDKLGEGKAWKQVKAISWIGEMFDKDSKPYSSIGKHLKKLSEKMGYDVRTVEDSQYGSVNVYHVNVIEAMKKELESDDLLLYRFREKKMRKKGRGVVHE